MALVLNAGTRSPKAQSQTKSRRDWSLGLIWLVNDEICVSWDGLSVRGSRFQQRSSLGLAAQKKTWPEVLGLRFFQEGAGVWVPDVIYDSQ